MNRPSPTHSHKFTIADDDAVRELVNKLTRQDSDHDHPQRLLRALDDAARHYEDSDEKVRQAFFHGLLTGYGVALRMEHQDGAARKEPRMKARGLK